MKHLIDEYGDVIICIAGFTALTALIGVWFIAGEGIAERLLNAIFYK